MTETKIDQMQPADSTNVRSDTWMLRMMRAVFPRIGPIAPGLAARAAATLFCAAPPARSNARTRSFLATGRSFEVRRDGMKLRAWRWGNGPLVYLVHGWGGRGAQLGSFVTPLLRQGFGVVAFDAPAHGASAGRLSSLVAFADALKAVVDHCGAAAAIVAHSMGSAATALAMQRRGLEADRVVFIGPPIDPSRWTDLFARELRVPDAVVTRMKDLIARRIGVKWEDLSVPAAAQTMTVPLLVVHDRDDAEVPWAEGAAIAYAWPDAQLVSTNGLGHRRILRDRAAVARVVSFVSGVPQDLLGDGCATCGEPMTATTTGSCEGCATEADLYDREARRTRVFPVPAARLTGSLPVPARP